MQPFHRPQASTRSATVLLAVLFAGACGGQPDAAGEPPFRPVSSVEELMHDVVLPHADEVWDSVGTIFTLEGTEEIYPRTEDEWIDLQGSARTLMEAGNLLMMEGRAKDTEGWMERAQALIDAGKLVLEAAEAQDAEAVFDRGELIYNACRGCHREYRYEEDPSIIRTY